MPDELGSGLHFLSADEDGSPYRRTRCWIKHEPGLAMTDWSLHLKRPEGVVEVVNDLKQWALFGTDLHRFLDAGGRGKASDLRRYERAAVLERYLQAVVAALPADVARERIWCLMPSVADPGRRKEYRESIERAIPKVKILHEPEMVLEYFRLVRRELHLEEGKSGVYLVVDAGASTTNFTFVLTRKDQKVVDASTGRERIASLRAKYGNAPGAAGKWIDEELARTLGLFKQLQALSKAQREDVLRALEAAKIKAARTGKPAPVEHASITSRRVDPLADSGDTTGVIVVEKRPSVTPEVLNEAAAALWARLLPTYREVADKFLADVQRGADATYFKERLSAAGVTDAGGVQLLIDGVILAGGTSRLPGFLDAMLAQVFPENPGVELHTVDDDYPIAAAIGALAHILDQRYVPSRLHAGADVDKPTSLASAAFHATPTTDVYWAWKRGSGLEEKILVLDRYDDLVRTGGDKPIDPVPNFELGAMGSRLIPGDEYSWHGRTVHPLVVQSAPVQARVHFDPALQEVKITSPQISRVGHLHMKLSDLWPEAEAPAAATVAAGTWLWTDGASDVVIDLGMSKTVVVTAGSGPFITSTGPDEHTDDWSGRPSPRADTQPAPPPPTTSVASAPPRTTAAHPPLASPPPIASAGPVAVAPSSPAAPPSPVPAPESPPPTAPVPATSQPARRKVAQAEEIAIAEFGARLEATLAPLVQAGQAAMVSDLTMLILSLAVRPFVLLSGPPGSGKSTVVRTAAQLLGLELDHSFFDVTVQPHWRTEKAVPIDARRAWEDDHPAGGRRLFLFDEINLTRPENYLMPFFRRLDHQGRGGGPLLACGTLNIDDTSRPPSPKVIDRCLLMEVDAPRDPLPRQAARVLRALPSGGIPALPDLEPLAHQTHEHVTAAVAVFRKAARDDKLRQDLLPSIRDLGDLDALVTLHREGRVPSALLTEDDLIDRAMAGRLLVKLAGAAEQVRPLVEELHDHFEKRKALVRCNRRLALARHQLELGFVSPWH